MGMSEEVKQWEREWRESDSKRTCIPILAATSGYDATSKTIFDALDFIWKTAIEFERSERRREDGSPK